MPSLFSKIISGELDGRFVWTDDHCVAFLTIAPIRRGHVLVVPREEVDHWIDADPQLWAHLSEVARKIGVALHKAFEPTRVGTMVAGFEIPHLHIHVLPIDTMADMDFANADASILAEQLDEDADRITTALRAAGFESGV